MQNSIKIENKYSKTIMNIKQLIRKLKLMKKKQEKILFMFLKLNPKKEKMILHQNNNKKL
jgi:hypothetical protein